MSKQVIVYMSPWCGTSTNTRRALTEWNVPAKYINIKEDREAAARVREWVGFESVPTVVISEEGSLDPFAPPAPLAAGQSPRGVDRGSILTEAGKDQLREWLVKNGLLEG
jgi:glutaredoxin